MRRLSKVEHEHYDKCRSVWTDFIDSLDANKGLHELKTRKLTIVPLFYKTSSEASGINKLADELFERGDDYLCYLVANSMDDFTSIEQGEVTTKETGAVMHTNMHLRSALMRLSNYKNS